MDHHRAFDHDPFAFCNCTLRPAYEVELGADDQQSYGLADHGIACLAYSIYHFSHRRRQQQESDLDFVPSFSDPLLEQGIDLSFPPADERQKDASGNRSNGNIL